MKRGSVNSERTRLVPAAIGSGVVLLLIAAFGLWLYLDGGAPFAIDVWWHDMVGLSPESAALPVARALHFAGGTIGVAACIAICAIALFVMRRWRDACALITAGVLGMILSETTKALVARPRPLDALVTEHSFSYPSGHSMGAALLTVSIALMIWSGRGSASPITKWAFVGAAIWTLAMMWSRTALQVHWLSDTIAGALLGVSVAILARMIFVYRVPDARLVRAVA